MDEFERKFLLQVPSSTENLAMIRQFLDGIGQQAGISEDEVAKIVLAVDEACSNVIEHAYQSDATQEVVIHVRFGDDALEVTISDTGLGFDPTEIEPKKLEELIAKRKKGGLGLRLIQTLMDEVHYDMEPGKKNQIQMLKKIAAKRKESGIRSQESGRMGKG
ncbi:MAG: ATP-binding protein [Acidobacteriota bacterium]